MASRLSQSPPPTQLPRLSIIIPVLDEAERIADAIQAAWRLHPLEVIVVDGGSRDATLDRAQAASQVVHSRPGRGTQLRAGTEVAQGDRFLFLHADTYLDPDARAQLMATPFPSCGAFRQAIDAAHWVYRWIERGNAIRAGRGLPYGDQAIFVDRPLLDRVGGIADIPLMEDVDLMLRLRRMTAPRLLKGPVYVSARRWQKRGVFRQTLRNWCILTAWRCGVPPETLVGWYG